jgi:opacity protein-like surface antigen
VSRHGPARVAGTRKKEHQMKKLLFVMMGVILFAAAPAQAQYEDRPVHVNLGGGFTMPVSDVSERFGTGGSFSIGLLFEPPQSPMFAFQVEYSYNGLAGEDAQIPLFPGPGAVLPSGNALIESHHNMQYISFNAMVRPGGDAMLKPYVTGGGGAYYRSVSLTTPSVGYTTWCDPYWYVCYPTLVEVDRIIGDRSSWDPGFNLGAGLTFKLGESSLFYVETRWHYMWGPEFTDGQGVVQKANGQYFPVTFGFRF